MKFNLKKLYNISLLSLLVIGSWAVSAHAVDDVRVTNWPTQYSIVNATWDQRLSTIQTTLQTLNSNLSQFPTFVSRFGWNGTLSFSQGFEYLYNDVHSMATSTSQGDLLTDFNREFENGYPASSSTSTKRLIRRIELALYSGTGQSYVGRINDNLGNFILPAVQHIDSDLHSLSSTVSAISIDVSSIDDNVLISKNLLNSNLPGIKVNTDNIAVDTEHISGTQDILVSQGAITMRNVGILREFFADDDTLLQKANAKQASDSALNNFTGNGQSAASAQNYVDIDWALSDAKIALGTGSVDAIDSTSVLTGSNSSAWGWFSQATYDSINPQPSRGGLLNAESYMTFYGDHLASENRKGVSDTPLLDNYYCDIEKAVGK